MKLLFNYLILCLFSCSLISCQDTPAARCTAMSNGRICKDCNHYALCTDSVIGLPAECPENQICDSTLVDGVCVEPVSTAISSCYCDAPGTCTKDPNDPNGYLICIQADVPGISSSPDDCDYSTQQFNVKTCLCQEASCPACGNIAADTSSCPKEYYSCGGSTTIGPISCGAQECFVDILDSLCGCIDSSFLSTINVHVTTPDSSLTSCKNCGLKKGDGCTIYYTCDTSGAITGTYYCPFGLCFDQDLCGCYA